ncbi:fungal hydrophobin [Trametes polyzona]|nr:fungal hydrophobin [Trametes polyzona]
MLFMLAAAFTIVTTGAILAVASPTPRAQSCSTGKLHCCNSVQSSNSLSLAPVLAAIGVVLQDLNIPIGIGCDPISIIPIGGANACSANTVCCENSALGGLLSIGCLPAIL